MITTDRSSPALQRNNNLSNSHIGGTFIHSHGTKVFVPNRIDVVQDAVEQARFNEKRWVWVQDEQQGYIRAQVVNDFKDDPHSTKQDQIEILHENGQTSLIPSTKVYPMNPPKFDRVADMAELTHLNEPSVIHNLASRYQHNEIYTYSGLFLVAVNPYRKLPIYTDEYVQSYKGRRRGELAPHIYAVAEEAYHDMVRGGNNQTILITGESGAGKTENTKIVIQYLTAVGNSAVRSEIEQQILQANPILEAFGNAQTIRNNNSSRFGKFIRIIFNKHSQVCGANIEWYLLEKSRVHEQAPMERNYHIFYQLLSADESLKEKLLLGGKTVRDYNFTKDSSKTIDGVDDALDFQKLVESMHIMGLSEEEQFDLFRIIAAVLHIGNMNVRDFRSERPDIYIEPLCHLLGIKPQEFKNSLLFPRIKAGREWVKKAISPEQLHTNLVALAKALYERNFSSLVDRINDGLDSVKPGDVERFVGVLDIAGFEIFDVNSFEQLCINYTNEKLQQFFNHSMFVLEQEQYQRENIEWDYIDFGLDLQPTINLIESSAPVGIFNSLEDECFVPQGSHKNMLHNLTKNWHYKNRSDKFEMSRFDDDSFTVKHYAGKVKYCTKGWVDKNKDPLNEDVTRLLARSTNAHVARLFDDYLNDNSGTPGSPIVSSGESILAIKSSKLRQGTGSFRTVIQRHKQQLAVLVFILESTHPRFIRCILPNSHKRAGEIQSRLVLDQLRCNGVLEGIRICRKGFPNRMPFDDFRKRFEFLYPDEFPPDRFIYGRKACEILLEKMGLERDRYRIGNSKVFFRATALAELEEIRSSHVDRYMTGFQAMCRRYIERQRITRVARQTEAIRVIQRNARIYVTLREWSWWKIYSKLRSMGEAMKDDIIMEEQRQKITQLEQHINEQSQEIQDLTVNYKSHVDTVTRQQAMIRELEESKQALIEKLAKDDEEMENAVKQSEAQANMIARLHDDIKECHEENEQLVTQYKGLQNTHETLAARVEYLENENNRLSKEKEQDAKENKQDADALRKELEDLRKSNEAYIEALMNERDEYKKKLEDTETHHRLAQDTFTKQQSELEEKINALQDKLQKESKERSNFETKHDALQTGWNDMASLLQTEASEAQLRAERFNQMLLQFGIQSAGATKTTCAKS